jgi:Tfp pilus assembly protein PilX
MPVRHPETHRGLIRRLRYRLRAEGGFTMIFALGVLMVTALLSAAMLAAVQGDSSLTRGDLNGKRSYAAAQAGVQAYLYALNSNATNSQWWETCANDTLGLTAVPGSTTGASYSYAPVTTCVTSDPVGSLIDTATGTLRMKFTGYAGTGCAASPAVSSSACSQRTIVASFRTVSPLSFLWYTVYESKDSSLPGATGCNQFYYNNPSLASGNCAIVWVTGDVMNGPMYTQDQFLVNPGDSPTFGRVGSQDAIASQVPTNGAADICASSNCYAATVSNPQPNVKTQVPLPSDNSNLVADAQKHGAVLSGTTTLVVNGSTNLATGYNCPTASSQQACTAVSIDLKAKPIIYATNASGCTSSSYTPTSVSYPQTTGTTPNNYYGPCGDIYIEGTYSTPVTIAAADDVVVTNNLTNSTDTNLTGTAAPTGTATLGLVANQYVRVQHDCSGNPNITIDAAILTLAHSFFVDNYDCGGSTLGKLTIHGAIAQQFRGVVGQVGTSGYLKNYNYDDRLGLILPPYLFDLQNTNWGVVRETSCTGAASTNPKSCAYTG